MSDLQYNLLMGKVEPGDHDKFSHYVLGDATMSGQDMVLRAMIEGVPVEALCGLRWVPTRDPERFPICPDCERIKREMGL